MEAVKSLEFDLGSKSFRSNSDNLISAFWLFFLQTIIVIELFLCLGKQLENIPH